MTHKTPETESLQHFVSEYYGRLLSSSADLKTNVCCASGAPPTWLAEPLRNVHPEVVERFYGCGFPIPQALSGQRVVDLGCGTGRDVYVLSQLVGEQGRVVGVDMTPEQLSVARKTESWHAQRFGYAAPNTRFELGYIEDLSAVGLRDASADVVVSNCVVNLSPRKDLVLSEVFRILAPGGEFYLSDVFCDRRLPPETARDPELYAECLGGALYIQDFINLAKRVGFADPREVSCAPLSIQNEALAQRVGAANFSSRTYRLFKLAGLDEQCEDYGQLVTYRGGLPGAERVFWLDDHHAFEAGRPERICGNTAAMLQETRLSEWFEVQGAKDAHYGAYPCEPTLAARQYGASTGASGACC